MQLGQILCELPRRPRLRRAHRHGRACRARARSAPRRIDVALLDIVMPELDGLEVLKQVARRGRSSRGHHHHGQRHDRDGHQRHEARRVRLSGQAVSNGGDRRARAPRVGEAAARARERVAAIRSSTRAGGAARSSRSTRRCRPCSSWSRASRRAIRPCSSPASRERGRSSSRARCIGSPAAPARSSTSTARPSPRACWRASCSATSAARSPAPMRAKLGLIELAAGGTLFLDEIAELSSEAAGQAAARARAASASSASAARRRSRSTCASSPRPTGISPRASTRARFRDDLFYRVNTIAIELPPLRDRAADIPLLAQHFLPQFGKAQSADARPRCDRRCSGGIRGRATCASCRT